MRIAAVVEVAPGNAGLAELGLLSAWFLPVQGFLNLRSLQAGLYKATTCGQTP